MASIAFSSVLLTSCEKERKKERKKERCTDAKAANFSATAFTEIEFSGATECNATENTLPAVSALNTDAFSTLDDFTSSSAVSAGSPFTRNTSNALSADYVYFGVYGTEEAIIKVLSGNVTSHTFTAAEAATLGSGSDYTQIAAVTYNNQIIDTISYWLINETVRTSTVTIE